MTEPCPYCNETHWGPGMRHTDKWYDDLARKLGHRGFVTLAEIRHEEYLDAKRDLLARAWTSGPYVWTGSYWLDRRVEVQWTTK